MITLNSTINKSVAVAPRVVTENTQAKINEVLHVVATSTITDPEPSIEGLGFTVLVVGGVATVGGVAYAVEGTVIRRIWHSGSWANQVDLGAVAATETQRGTVPGIGGTAAGNAAKVAQLDSVAQTGNVVWVDKVNGNDSTGERGRTDKPFLNLIAAQEAALDGDLVYVRPGVYSASNLGKNGVNWFFAEGTKINGTASGGECIFGDQNNPKKYRVLGGLHAFLESSTEEGEPNPLIYVQNEESEIEIQAKCLESVDLVDIQSGLVALNEGKCKIVADLLHSHGNQLVRQVSGSLEVEVDEIRTDLEDSYCFDVQGGASNIKIKYANTLGVIIYDGGSDGTPLVVARVDRNNENAFGPAFYVNCKLVAEAGVIHGALTSSSPLCDAFIKCGKLEGSAVQPMISSDGGAMVVEVGKMNINAGLCAITTGSLTIKCNDAVIAADGPPVEVYGGALKLAGKFKSTGASTFSNTFESGSITLDNATIVVPSGQTNSFAPSASRDLVVYSGRSNKPVSGNVNQLVSSIVVSADVI
jgi:hypothetical protein